MQFHLNYTPKKSDFEINHHHKIALIGSCFAENIGELLHENKFNILLNPNGIIFNPKTILDIIQKSIKNTSYNASILIKQNHLVYSFLHHSSINEISESELVKKINGVNYHLFNNLKEADFLMLTFGSAYAYYQKELNIYVANCHKQHSDIFEKKLLHFDELVKDYLQLIQQLQNINPKLKIIFTVSPVKYLKVGLEENFISKSTLRLAIDCIISQTKNCFYFPAFELITDDLRDYRFYKEDLAHPNQQAIEYVWQKFSNTFFNIETILLNKQLKKLNVALNHRVLQGKKEELIKHQNYILKLKEELNAKYSFLDL